MQPNQSSPAPDAPRLAQRRRARRMVLIGTAAGLAVAVIAAGTALASAGPHQGHGTTPAAFSHRQAAHARAAKAKLLGGARAAAQRRAVQHQAARRRPAARPAPPKTYGAVIRTGIRGPAGELVFYAVKIHIAQLPHTTFGVMGGYQKAGKLSAGVESNEVTGPDTAPGFHAVESPMNANGHPVPEFGYYAGPAAKITGIIGGRRVQASHARWSINPTIVIFWFSPRGNPAAHRVTGLAAYNTHGKPLPTGHNTPGLG